MPLAALLKGVFGLHSGLSRNVPCSSKAHLCPSCVGTEKKPLVSSPRGGGAAAQLTLSSQDAQHTTPSGMSLQAFASQASTILSACSNQAQSLHTCHHGGGACRAPPTTSSAGVAKPSLSSLLLTCSCDAWVSLSSGGPRRSVSTHPNEWPVAAHVPGARTKRARHCHEHAPAAGGAPGSPGRQLPGDCLLPHQCRSPMQRPASAGSAGSWQLAIVPSSSRRCRVCIATASPDVLCNMVIAPEPIVDWLKMCSPARQP